MANPNAATSEAEIAGRHYCRPEGGLECFQAFNLKHGDAAAIYAAMFNVEKYLFRHDIKHDNHNDMIQDLRKATAYIGFMIDIYKRQSIEE